MATVTRRKKRTPAEEAFGRIVDSYRKKIRRSRNIKHFHTEKFLGVEPARFFEHLDVLRKREHLAWESYGRGWVVVNKRPIYAVSRLSAKKAQAYFHFSHYEPVTRKTFAASLRQPKGDHAAQV